MAVHCYNRVSNPGYIAFFIFCYSPDEYISVLFPACGPAYM